MDDIYHFQSLKCHWWKFIKSWPTCLSIVERIHHWQVCPTFPASIPAAHKFIAATLPHPLNLRVGYSRLSCAKSQRNLFFLSPQNWAVFAERWTDPIHTTAISHWLNKCPIFCNSPAAVEMNPSPRRWHQTHNLSLISTQRGHFWGGGLTLGSWELWGAPLLNTSLEKNGLQGDSTGLDYWVDGKVILGTRSNDDMREPYHIEHNLPHPNVYNMNDRWRGTQVFAV